jgi:hypothetical protein
MTLTIEISPEEEAHLVAQARQRGEEIGDIAHDLLRSGLGLGAGPEFTEGKHALLTQLLRDAGLLTEMPSHPGQTVLFHPITVIGPPVSQTLLEDRE